MKFLSLILVVMLSLTACGGADTGSDHNDQDVTFAQDMIPHHRQGVEMSDLASSRASSDEVKALAAEMRDAQDLEIQTMETWLEEWGEEVPGDHMAGMDGMSEMMSDEDMGMFANASGSAFDEMFLTMMIAHHEGAIEMADEEIADGENSGAIELADQIKATQADEIVEMNSLLDR